MYALLYRIVLVLGFCLAAVGASGFADEVEPLAWPFFLGGLVATTAGGLLLRRETRKSAEGEGTAGAASDAELARGLAEIAAEVARLDDEKDTVSQGEFCTRIDTLLTGPCFEIGGRNEDYARLLGPSTFAHIWEGFATAERLLARAWSMATDDHLAEARIELTRARGHIEHAASRSQEQIALVTPQR